MKKITCILLLTLILLLTGCQSLQSYEQKNTEDTEKNQMYDDTHLYSTDTINVKSLDELNEMRDMSKCEDVEQLNQYLYTVSGGGAKERRDLLDFLNLVDTLPYVSFIEGNITWISYTHTNEYYTGNPYSTFYITITSNSDNDNFVRLEYILSENDILSRIEESKKDFKEIADDFSPIVNDNGRIKVYVKAFTEHQVVFLSEIDGIYVRIVASIELEDLFSNNHSFENTEMTTIAEHIK